jgi:hypothetical protein
VRESTYNLTHSSGMHAAYAIVTMLLPFSERSEGLRIPGDNNGDAGMGC